MRNVIDHLLSLFAYDHLPEHLQVVSKPSHDLAHAMAGTHRKGIELEVGLRKLLEAKDCFVRQAVADKRDRDNGVRIGI